MLIKPDEPPSQTTSCRPISLLSAILKLFERVIEKCLEDNGFFSKYQSGFRKSKSTNDHLFRLSQTIMESFNRGEHVIAEIRKWGFWRKLPLFDHFCGAPTQMMKISNFPIYSFTNDLLPSSLYNLVLMKGPNCVP